jgi:hypothetical protein
LVPKHKPPLPATRTQGVESGLLVNSINLRARRSTFVLRVSKKRATNAILSRVFKKGLNVWSRKAFAIPEVQEQLRMIVPQQMVAGAIGRGQLRGVAHELGQSFRNLNSLLEQAESTFVG